MIQNEMFYGHFWVWFSFKEFISELNDYIHWYNCKRIKLSLGGFSPSKY